MTVRIAILGGPRCGKTTLIQQLYVDLKIRDINVGKNDSKNCNSRWTKMW